MKAAIINGYLYWIEGNKVWLDDMSSFTTTDHLTKNEREQIWKYTNNELYKEYLANFIKKHEILHRN